MTYNEYNLFRDIKERDKKLAVLATDEYKEIFQVLKDDIRALIKIIENQEKENELA